MHVYLRYLKYGWRMLVVSVVVAIPCAGSRAPGALANGAGPNVGSRLERTVDAGGGTPHTLSAGQQPGWQLISLPYAYSSDPLVNGGLLTARWSAPMNSYVLNQAPLGNTYQPGQGFWAYIAGDAAISASPLSAAQQTSVTLPLDAGWNMVGDPYPGPVPLSSVRILTSGDSESISSSNLIFGTSPLYSYNITVNQYIAIADDSQNIRPWAGYWLYSPVAAALLITQPSGPPDITSSAYQKTALVSDVTGSTSAVDSNLVDPWGVASDPRGGLYVVNNTTAVGTTYSVGGSGTFNSQQSPDTLFPVSYKPGVGPTGAVANPVPGTFVTVSGIGNPIIFSYTFFVASEDGRVIGAYSDHPVFTENGAIYKGIAMARGLSGEYLYVTNFASGVVERIDGKFHLAGSFSDPNIPAGFAPFGIATVNGNVYVSYAQKAADGIHDQPGPGNGYVDVFTPDGTLIKQLVVNGPLNSPWGMVLAPSNFGIYSSTLLVANHGDGKINIFDPDSGAYLGTLPDSSGNPIVIDGLWGLTFGNGALAGPTNTLYFTAGPAGGTHGLMGKIEPAGSAGR